MTEQVVTERVTTDEGSSHRAQRQRMVLVAVVLAVTALAAVPLGVGWPSSSTGNGSYAFSDIAPVRQQWWWVLTLLAALLPLNVGAQAVATMALVRRRGSSWATWGGAVMVVGAALQAIGITFLAGAYYFATDPAVAHTAASDVLRAISAHQGRLYATLVPGAVLTLLGTAVQVVGLFRSRAVPRWIPTALAFIVATFVVPGDGAIGLLTSLPTAAGAMGLAYYLVKL